jgi:hypothetical protein
MGPNYEVLGGTAEGSATTYTASDTYSISDIYFTSEAFSFSDDTYYNSIGDKDLKFGFNDYVVTKFANVQKVNDINVTTYLSAGSIDYVMGTALLPQSVPKPMVAYGSLGTGAAESTVANIYKYLSDPVAYEVIHREHQRIIFMVTVFTQLLAMQRCLQHLDTSQWSINNKTLNYAPLNKYEVFYNNLLALGYENVDMSANGLAPYNVSLLHYLNIMA